MSRISEESDSAFEHFYCEGYGDVENNIAQQDIDDWENREQYGIEW